MNEKESKEQQENIALKLKKILATGCGGNCGCCGNFKVDPKDDIKDLEN